MPLLLALNPKLVDQFLDRVEVMADVLKVTGLRALLGHRHSDRVFKDIEAHMADNGI
jgi:hypothetical protein